MNPPINIQTIKPLTGNIPSIPDFLNLNDYFGTLKVRWGIGRDKYLVKPGLYKIGHPTSESDVLVSANYKLSFDTLRKNLKTLNAWILVIDTKGVNVWCAAGKGTFSTDNIVKEIKNSSLDLIVKHRRIIVPQLGAPGVAAHIVKELSGFKVIYGPVMAKDIKLFIESGYKATPEMRKVNFPFKERIKLIPVDFMYGKYKLLIILTIAFLLSGIDKTGILFSKMLNSCSYPITSILGSYIAGIVIAPMFLPHIPFRAFALKGAFWGLLFSIGLQLLFHAPLIESAAMIFFNTGLASFATMNFTGSSTYTSLSGVKREMKWAVPLQIAFAAIGLILFIVSKLI
jgi:hypothetical protein